MLKIHTFNKLVVLNIVLEKIYIHVTSSTKKKNRVTLKVEPYH